MVYALATWFALWALDEEIPGSISCRNNLGNQPFLNGYSLSVHTGNSQVWDQFISVVVWHLYAYFYEHVVRLVISRIWQVPLRALNRRDFRRTATAPVAWNLRLPILIWLFFLQHPCRSKPECNGNWHCDSTLLNYFQWSSTTTKV